MLHALPVAYEANDNFKPENHLAFRLIRRDQCGLMKDTQGQITTFGMHFQNKFRQDICVLRYPEAPQHKTITAVTKDGMEIWPRRLISSNASWPYRCSRRANARRRLGTPKSMFQEANSRCVPYPQIVAVNKPAR